VELPQFFRKTLDAMAEAKRISRDPSVHGYGGIGALKRALES